MPLTIDEITQREEDLRQEIAERERLLAAYQLIRSDRAKPTVSASLGAPLAPAEVLRLEAPAQPLLEEGNRERFTPPKVNPALAAIRAAHGAKSAVVAWAIERMTVDYTVSDLAALLAREGHRMPSVEISVVLTRFKAQGKIEEIKCGRGRRASVYRKPVNTAATTDGTPDLGGGTESLAEEAAA